jgi:hypothetical protein
MAFSVCTYIRNHLKKAKIDFKLQDDTMRILFFLGLLIASTIAIPTAELGETSGPCDSDVTGKPCGLTDGYVGTYNIQIGSRLLQIDCRRLNSSRVVSLFSFFFIL